MSSPPRDTPVFYILLDEPGEERGEYVCRDDLGWVGRPDLAGQVPGWRRSGLPLIAFRSPSITRAIATAALARAAVDWRLACASDSLSGLTAAALAGLGVTVLAKGLIPSGLCDLGLAMLRAAVQRPPGKA